MTPSPRQAVRKPQQLLDGVATWIATGAYSGYFPTMPATIGSALGLLLYLPLTMHAADIQLTLTGTLFAIGMWASDRAEQLMGTKDARPIVIDEIAGMWVATLFLPYRISYFLAAFLLFRLFDIVKPFPADQAQHLKGGLGVMLDDVIAGLYTNAVLHGVQTFKALLSSA